MERRFDEQLKKLKHDMIRMSALVEAMIGDATKSLVDRDANAAKTVEEKEKVVNEMQRSIDEECLELIALHQPTAGDLRFILGIAKTIADLERLGDQCINIINKSERLNALPPLKPFDVIPSMAKLAAGMVRDALHAYVNTDVESARSVCLRDDELDALKEQITGVLVEKMKEGPDNVERGMALALVARNLERIGDHATNIAENTIFVAEGRDIRHGGGRK